MNSGGHIAVGIWPIVPKLGIMGCIGNDGKSNGHGSRLVARIGVMDINIWALLTEGGTVPRFSAIIMKIIKASIRVTMLMNTINKSNSNNRSISYKESDGIILTNYFLVVSGFLWANSGDASKKYLSRDSPLSMRFFPEAKKQHITRV
jgi:hypothetical protein